MKFDIKGWKKIRGSNTHSIMRNEEGHSLKIAHAPLNAEHRKMLMELPMEAHESPKAKASKMADGGPVRKPAKDDVPEPDPKKAKAFVEGMQQSPVETIKSGWQNAKQELGFADGGDVEQQLRDQNPQGSISYDSAGQMPQQTIEAPPAAEAPIIASQSAPAGLDIVKRFAGAMDQPGGLQPAIGGGVDPQMVAGASPQQPAPAAAQPAQSAGNDPYGTQAFSDAYMRGLGEEKSGLAQEANTAQALGEAQAQAIGEQQAKAAANQLSYQNHYKELEMERQGFLKDMQDQKIDAGRFMANMSTGTKIRTAIGLILGGIGGGLTHTDNPVDRYLQMQINNDIEAQKANLGKTESLLKANYQSFGNLKDATDMTRVMQMDFLSNQLKQEAAKQSGPMAKANLLRAAGKLDMDAAPIVSQMAARKTLASGMQQGRVAPEQVIRLIVPKEEQANATKQLQEAQMGYHARDNALSAFDKVAKLNTAANRTMSPIQSGRQIDALQQPTVAMLSKELAGKFTEADAHALSSQWPQAGDDAQTAAIKRQQFEKIISEKLHFPELKKWGIDLSSQARYNPQGQNSRPLAPPVRPGASSPKR